MAQQEVAGQWMSASFRARLERFGQALSAGDFSGESHKYNLNYLNYKNNNLKPTQASSKEIYPVENNLNYLNREKTKKTGITRRQLFADPALRRLLDWGVKDWLICLCAREYGLHVVRGESNRINALPLCAFNENYGPIETQRGRYFNKAMDELRGRASR